MSNCSIGVFKRIQRYFRHYTADKRLGQNSHLKPCTVPGGAIERDTNYGSIGRRSPPPKKKAKMLSLQFISNYIGKSSRRDEVSVHTVTFLKVVSKCIRLHLRAYLFQKIFRGARRQTPLGSTWPSATQDFFPKR